MENVMRNPKLIVAGLFLSLVFCLSAAIPAMAQDGGGPSDDDLIDDDSVTDIQYGDNIETGDINSQVCQNIIGDLNINSSQYSDGDNIAIGDGNIQAIAQEQNVNVNIVQNCINLINSSIGGTPPGDQYTPEDPPDNGDDDDTNTDDTNTDDDNRDVNSEGVILATVPDKVLANTGGVSAAGVLLPAGALLVASGMMVFWIGRRRG